MTETCTLSDQKDNSVVAQNPAWTQPDMSMMPPMAPWMPPMMDPMTMYMMMARSMSSMVCFPKTNN